MLTPAQKQTLKTNINATPAALAFYTNGDLPGLADYYNTLATPAFTIWRTSVTVDEIMSNGFDWARVDNASIGKARIWEWMRSVGTINPSKANIRDGIEQAWSGVANDAMRASIYVHCKRLTTRLERLFATGTGSDAVPGQLVVVGPLDYTELIGL